MLIKADARRIPLRDGIVQCVVTSPPYWGLRDYGAPGQIGAERTPDEYITEIVGVFEEVWRVLADDGTVWLNLGDSYTSGGRDTFGTWSPDSKQATHTAIKDAKRAPQPPWLKPKDLVGIPWRVAFALQAHGWYLRSDIIWSKPNPMPESVTDRPTKAHEYIFLLTKSERYYYDAAAIREPYAASTLREFEDGYDGQARKDYDGTGAQNPSDTKRRIIERVNARRSSYRPGSASSMNDGAHIVKSDAGLPLNPDGRNKRTVWTVTTQPYPDAHFATYPEALIEPCILAGSRAGDLVLDPFIGSGTTGVVCDRLMRRWVGLDLNYQHLSKKRTAQRGLRFAAISETEARA